MLKIDTQGFDLDVVAGAGELLKAIPIILMEVPVEAIYDGAPTIEQVLGTMRQHGYEVTGWFPVHRYAQGARVIEFDCTFVNLRRC